MLKSLGAGNDVAIPAGFEPATRGVEIRYSSQGTVRLAGQGGYPISTGARRSSRRWPLSDSESTSYDVIRRRGASCFRGLRRAITTTNRMFISSHVPRIIRIVGI